MTARIHRAVKLFGRDGGERHPAAARLRLA
jgi:hypothetical protein